MPSGAIERLRQQPEPSGDLLGRAATRIALPSSSTAPARRREQPGQRAQQRRLAARVRPDDHGELAVRDRHGQVVDDDALVVGERHAAARRAAGGRVASSARPRLALGDEQPDQVDAADDAGDDADRQLGRREQPLRDEVARPAASSAPISAAGQRRPTGASRVSRGRAAARRGRRTRSARRPRSPRRPRARRRDTISDPGALDADAERAGGVVAHLQQAAAAGRPAASAAASTTSATASGPDLVPAAAVERADQPDLRALRVLEVGPGQQVVDRPPISMRAEPDADQHQPVARHAAADRPARTRAAPAPGRRPARRRRRPAGCRRAR